MLRTAIGPACSRIPHSARSLPAAAGLPHFAALLAALFPLSAVAETITWTGGAGTSSWHTAANWDLNRVPGTGDDVVIPAVGASADVRYTNGSSTSINSLTSDKSFVLTSGTLDLAAASAINAAYTQSGGILQGSGTINVGALLTWSGGNMQGTGTTNANGGMAISDASGSDPFLFGSRVLVNAVGQTATLAGSDRVLRLQDTATFTNNGTLNITAASGGYIERFLSPQIINNGTLNRSTAGTFTIQPAFNNANAVQVNSGTLELGNGGTSTGSFDGTGTLAFTGGTHSLTAASSVTVNNVAFTGAITTVSGTYDVPGTTSMSGGTTNFNSTAADTVAYTQSGGILQGSGTINVGALLTWSGGNMQGTGTTNANGGMAISDSSGSDPLMFESRVLVNAAGQTATLAGSERLLRMQNTATLTNNGTLNISAGDGSYIEYGGVTPQVVNNGTLNKNSAGTLTMDVAFNNNNAVHADSGTLQLSRGGTSTGNFDGAAALAFSGGTHSLTATSSVTTNNVTFSGGTSTTIAGAYNVPGTTTVSGSGTVNFNSTATIAAYTQSGGTLQGSGAMNVSGLLTWSGGTMQGSGATTANGGMAISDASGSDPLMFESRVLVNAAGQTATLAGSERLLRMQNTATLTNNGTLDITAADGSYIEYGGGSPQVINNGTLNKSSAGTSAIQTTFNNANAVHVNSGTLLLNRGGTHTGSFDGAAKLAFSGGTHSLAASSSITTNDVDVASGATLNIILSQSTPGGYGQINIAGHATLNGGLNFTVLPAFSAVACDELLILTYGTRTSGFSPAPTPFPVPDCVFLEPEFDDPAGTFKLVSVEDCDCDGVLDDTQPGACCIDGTACSIVTPSTCLSAGGVPLGRCTPCPTQNAFLFGEPGGEIFVHVIGPPIQCAAAAAAEPCPAEPPVCPPGQPLIDPWVSPADPSMRHQFGVEGSPAIPADFFGPGSDPFTGFVQFEGEPLGLPEFGAADTLIERMADPFGLCDLPSATAVDVPIEITALSLRSVDPMTVTYSGVNPEDWDVDVDLSPTITPPVGMLTATKTHCNGGTYTSTLHVQPRFTFTKVADPGQVRVLDTGAEGIPHVTLVQTDPIGWVSQVEAALGVQGDACSDFHAGIDEPAPRSACDLDNDGTANACDNCPDDANADQADADADDVGDLCDNCPYRANPDQADGNSNNIGDACEPPFCTAPEDCNSNGTPDDCDVASGASLDCNTNAVPDECDPDCNANGRPDDCDIALGQRPEVRDQRSEVRGQPLDRESLLGPPLRGIPSPDSALRTPHSALAQGQSSIVLSPADSTGPVGAYHTLTALVTDGGTPVMGALVTFEALSGPNSGTLGTDETDANGEATLAYVGAQGEGTDQIVASYNDGQTVQSSNTVSRTWLGSLDCNFNGTPDECEGVSAPAATLLGGVSRRLHGGAAGDCDLALNVAGRVQNDNVSSEPRSGGISELRLRFDIPPGGPGISPVAIHQQACPGGTQGHYQLYSGPSSIAASIEGAELVLVFTPALANARTYRITVGPEVTGVPCQSIEVRALAGDATGNGRVDAGDRSAVVGAWTGSGFSCKTDITRDGTTNAGDRSAVVGAWTNPAGNCAP